MQDEPRNISFSVPLRWAAWITLAAIAKLSYRNSARSVLLATMPPTLAAARNTACGRFLANQPNTAAWSRRSTSLRPTVSSSTSSRASLRISADPTMPRWPATKTVLPLSSNGALAICCLLPRVRQIAGDHILDELTEARLRLPTEFLARLGRISDQQVDFGGTEIGRIDTYDRLAGFFIDAAFVDSLA